MRNKKIKIGINASFLRKPYTGIGQVTENFLKKLASYGKEFDFVLYLEEELPRDLKLPKNFKTRVFLPVWKRDDLVRKIWWEKYSLPTRLQEDDCQILISLYQCPTIIKKEGIRHIMVVHDIIPKIFPEYLDDVRKLFYWRLTEKGIRQASKIIAVSKHTEKDLINYLNVGGQKITTNYIAADEIFANRSEKDNARVLKKYKLKPGYILAGGGYEKRKNVAGVIRAYADLLERNKKEGFLNDFPKLVIYGKILPSFLPLATDAGKILRELNLTKQVKLLDLVAQKDLPALYASAKCFVYPSFYEGFGLQVLEAMKSGVPVIAARNSAMPEVGLDSVLYCHPDDMEDLAMVMKNLLTKEFLQNELTRRGIERSKIFSWDKFTEKIINILKSEIHPN